MKDEIEQISSERIDDIPVVVEWLRQMQIVKWIDKKLSQPHGNHQGLSYGQLSVLLLTYIITQADHRLCAVEEWVKEHRKILEMTTGWSIGEKDPSDDRLARVVEELGKQEEACREIEVKLGQHLIRAYELPTEVARADTTSFSVYHRADRADPEGILKYGYSKDKRPDLLQYRQSLTTLDPAGMPIVSTTLPGNGADDPLYWPIWQQMAKVIGHKQFVFIADCKAAAIATRAQIAAAGGRYCFPLPMTGQNPLWLKQWVLNQHQPSEEIFLPTQKEDEVAVAVGKGFEVELGKFWLNPDSKKSVHWHERYLVVYSNSFAAAQIRGQEQRLNRAETALEQLASNPGADVAQLHLKVKAILSRHQVSEFLAVTITEQVLVHTRYVQRGRPSATSGTKQLTEIQFQLEFVRLSAPIEQAQLLAGWRLYVTNVPLKTLSLSQAVFYYRQEWLVEHGFHRFKRGHLPALPIYFQNQDRIAGLMFLLSLALRVFTLIEFVVRQALTQTHQSLPGLYEGNPRRETPRPSTEQLLKAFRHLTLYCFPDLTFFITPLSELQRRILSLMNLPASLYQLDLTPCKT